MQHDEICYNCPIEEFLSDQRDILSVTEKRGRLICKTDYTKSAVLLICIKYWRIFCFTVAH